MTCFLLLSSVSFMLGVHYDFPLCFAFATICNTIALCCWEETKNKIKQLEQALKERKEK